mmetsp:Transcript_69570/g.220276  ORF Transcript_69570/g.220276 Transcript_69570/m.220276 type:complete len:202 (-) Transcript_69570:253-858(-)
MVVSVAFHVARRDHRGYRADDVSEHEGSEERAHHAVGPLQVVDRHDAAIADRHVAHREVHGEHVEVELVLRGRVHAIVEGKVHPRLCPLRRNHGQEAPPAGHPVREHDGDDPELAHLQVRVVDVEARLQPSEDAPSPQDAEELRQAEQADDAKELEALDVVVPAPETDGVERHHGYEVDEEPSEEVPPHDAKAVVHPHVGV